MDRPSVDQTRASLDNNNGGSHTADGMAVTPPNQNGEEPSRVPIASTAEPVLVEDLENHPPHPPLDMISASSNDPNNHLSHDNDPLSMEVDIAALEGSNDRLAPPRGPLREEPTLKEKLVDRERQRRKEAERARLKRQFALMSNGGGLVYDSAGGGGGASFTGLAGGAISITGTVGEESTHADMEDSVSGMMHSHSHHRHQGGENAPQLGYTMERFLQETATTSAAANNSSNSNNNHTICGVQAVASINASSTNASNVIREEAIEGDPNTAGAPDKGVVMERFLNDPVVVDTAPPPTPAGMPEDPQAASRADDVHRSVSFDMEVRTTQNPHSEDDRRNLDENSRVDNDPMEDHLHLSIDDSNASVRVEVAPEDDMLEPVSPGGRLSVPSEVAPSSLETDDHPHHHRQISEMETSIGMGSVGGPSIDRQSLSSNVNNANDDDDDTADEPRVFRLTEAEIQEMAAIEEASIGNAPPSDRDAESLVGDLVGTFGTPNVGEAGTNFSQETTTTAMESGSVLSGHPLSAQQSSAMPGDQPPSTHGGDMDDMDHNSIDDMVMSAASVSSHLAVSVSGSAASVTANPPSEIIGRAEGTTMSEADHDRNAPVSPPPSSVVVDNASEIQAFASPPVSVVEDDEHRASGAAGGESRSSIAIREELKASNGPPAEDIVNRRLRPGMVEAVTASAPQHSAGTRNIASLPASGSSIVDTPKIDRTVEEFDFDKNDIPMTPRSLMSDSLRDLPGDELWTGATMTKMTVSPLLDRSRDALYNRSNAAINPNLAVPSVPQAPAIASNSIASKSHDERQRKSGPAVSLLGRTFHDVRTNNSATVEAKEAELYSRGSIQSKALESRLLPLVLTCIIEVPALRMIIQDSRLCSVVGKQHYQLLLGFIPLIAAISGNGSAQASLLTTKAICHGHVTSQSYWNWTQKECKVAGVVGLGMGVAVGFLAFSLTSGSAKENLAFAMAVGIAQWISLTLAGCTGSNFPVLMCLLFKENSLATSVQRAFVDVISTLLTCVISYSVLQVFVSQVDPVDACIA